MESFCEYTVRGEVKYYLNFSKLDVNSSYLIGYLACDGAFINHKYPRMSVNSTEKYIIEEFKQRYCPNSTIYFIGKKSSTLVRATNDVYELRFPPKMNVSFNKFGIFTYKKDRRIVGIPNAYLKSYVAGCIDADGFITVTHRKDCRTPRIRFFITHISDKFLADLQNKLEYLGVTTTLRQHGANVYRLQAQNTEQNKIFLNSIKDNLKNKKKKKIVSDYITKFYVPQASGELLEGEQLISSQAQDTSCEGSETTGELECS